MPPRKSVDFQKSGIPVNSNLFPRPSIHLKPDFLSPEGATAKQLQTKYYPSGRALGRLFRAIDLRETTASQRKGNQTRLSRFERHGSVIEQQPQTHSAVNAIKEAVKSRIKLAGLSCELNAEDQEQVVLLYEAYVVSLSQRYSGEY